MNQKFINLLEELDEDSFSREKYALQRYGKPKTHKATGEKEFFIVDADMDEICPSFKTREEAQTKLNSMKDKKKYKIYVYQNKMEESEDLDENIMSGDRRKALIRRFEDGEASKDDVMALSHWGLVKKLKDGTYVLPDDPRLKEDLDEGRGRPKKDRSNEEPKVPGKRGRPKKDDIEDPEDDESKAGKRDLTLTAKIIGGKGKNKQSAEETKTIKDAKASEIDKVVRDYENILSVKYANKWDFDEDEITVQTKDNLGWTGAKAEDQTKDDEGSDAEDDAYSFGRMEK
jgi:hypothetical protein